MPETQFADWPGSDIDRFLLAGLEAQGLRPVSDAAPLRLLRRISYDLSGLPPTPERIAKFEADYRENAASAVASVVNQMLSSPRFGERWGRHWLDVARYAESNGGTGNILVPLCRRYSHDHVGIEREKARGPRSSRPDLISRRD